MKFLFRLEKVLQHRKRLEILAQKDFYEADEKKRQAIDVMDEMINEISKARQRAFALQTHGGKPQRELADIDQFIKGQDVRIEIQRSKVKEIEKIVEAKREILQQKAIDYKIMDKLKDKKKNEFLSEVSKIEQKNSDEQSSIRMFYKEKEKGS
jgi:flagellar FliJ protein